MNPQSLLLTASIAGLVLNTFAIFGIAWRGGHLLGRLEGGMESITKDLARIATQLDFLEDRVGHLEGRK